MHTDDNETAEERPSHLTPSLRVKDKLDHTSTPVYPAPAES